VLCNLRKASLATVASSAADDRLLRRPGKTQHTLFITASKGLYGLRMRVKGVGSQ
jgi:hypothetical protein